MPFDKPYLFKKTNTVVIEHPGGNGGKHLRAKPGDLEEADPDGGKGQFAQWEADPQDGGSKCRFKSLKSGKYLRIVKGGDEVNIGGGGGKFTVFKVHQWGGKGEVKLESEQFPGLIYIYYLHAIYIYVCIQINNLMHINNNNNIYLLIYLGKYIAVGKNNKVRTGGGGPWCKLKIFRKTE